MMLMEFDKAGAEWVVVAYVSGDARMIQVVESGESPHVATGHLISNAPKDLISKEDKIIEHERDPDVITQLRLDHVPDLLKGSFFLPRTMSIRQAGKKSNHGLNYGMKYRRFALENEMDERDAKRICELYTGVAYMGLPLWWNAIKQQLKKDRTLINCAPFNRKVRLLDAWGDDLFNQAYSFIPQSTVGDMVNRGLYMAYEDMSAALRPADLQSNVHDSLVCQYPTDDWTRAAEFAIILGLEYMSPELEYNTRKFIVKTDLKIGKRWGRGHMVEVQLVPDVHQMKLNLQEAWNEVHDREAM